MSLSSCRPLPWRAASLVLAALALTACESPLHSVRAQRFGEGTPPPAVKPEPRALALGLQATPDQQALTAQAMQAANLMLTRQGRLGDQTLSLTPFSAQAEPLARRVAQALTRSGARAPLVLPVPTDATRLQQAQTAGWALELQSEALVVDTTRCKIANSNSWTIHPYYGVGALGCASRGNVARMVTDPRDLARPRVLEAADGRASSLAIERYQSGEIRDLIDIDFEE